MGTRVLCLAAALHFVLAAPARAADVTVDCDNGGSIQAALNLLDPVGPHTITVTGTCEESLSIFQRDRVTIQAPDGGTATIVSPSTTDVVDIGGSRNITLRRLVVRGGGNGIAIRDGSLVLVEDCTVEAAAIDGVVLQYHSTLRLVATTLAHNPGWGLRVMQASQAVLAGGQHRQLLIHWNGNGLYCTESSACLLNGWVTIEHNGFGLAVTRTSSGRVTAFLGPNAVRANYSDGVVVNFNSWVAFSGAYGNIVEQNTTGFNVEQNSSLMVTDTTVAANAGPGFYASMMAYVHYGSGNAVSGNQGPAFGCDATSLLLINDELSGFMPQDLACRNVWRGDPVGSEQGPPRPGRFD